MRDILFRAKITYDGNWVEGYFAREDLTDKALIFKDVRTEWGEIAYNKYLVDEDTLGLCSYLLDDTGRIIYEGDIVYVSNQQSIIGVVCYGITTEVDGMLYEGFFYRVER